jgi:hypothetical protein
MGAPFMRHSVQLSDLTISHRLMRSLLRTVTIAALVLVPPAMTAAQQGAVVINDLTSALGTTGRVLMIGAHPDDEDTNLLAWLARGAKVDAAYLSLTRGDGGQNAIGTELGEGLGENAGGDVQALAEGLGVW